MVRVRVRATDPHHPALPNPSPNLVDSTGEIHGRPDMVAFAKVHPKVTTYIKALLSP